MLSTEFVDNYVGLETEDFITTRISRYFYIKRKIPNNKYRRTLVVDIKHETLTEEGFLNMLKCYNLN